MRVLVHDHSGHPFQVQLSRELARRGHTVLHAHNSVFESGKGALTLTPGDPSGFSVEPIRAGERFDKYSVVSRHLHEYRYGGLLVDAATRFRPDIMVSTNEPLLVATVVDRYRQRHGVPGVFWLQDFYSVAMQHALRRRLPVGHRTAGKVFTWTERRLLARSDRVVAISPDFLAILNAWHIEPSRCDVIENWAPIDELPRLPRDNDWSRAHGLAGKRVVLYAGTLGLKHDPSLLLSLAQRFSELDDVEIVVASEGLGAGWLRNQVVQQGLTNLRILGYQPFDQLPMMLASADVLVTLLEPLAGTFSVPSKVLSYFCAGRPVLAAIPPENLAARTIAGHEAGIAVEPGDREAFVAGATRLLEDEALRRRLGDNARRYAEERFPIGAIADRFECILTRAVDGRPAQPAGGRSKGGASGAGGGAQYLSGRSAS